MELFRLLGTIAVENSAANKAIDTTTSKAKTAGAKLAGTFNTIGEKSLALGNKLSSHITKPAMIAGAALAGITLKKGWSRMTEIDNARAKLIGLGHDGDEVKTIMNNALESVKGTAYGMDEAATTAASAVAAGIPAGEELTRYLTLVGDAAAIAGTDMSEMGSIFNKVASNGKISAEEMNQLADRGIPIWKLLAETTGMSMDQVREAVSSGKIGIEELQDAIENGMGGAAKTLGSTTITGAISNISASISRIGANFLGSADDADSFAGQLLPVLNNVQKWLGTVEEKAKDVGEKFGSAFSKAVEIISKIPAPLVAVGSGIAILSGPILQLAGKFMIAQSAIMKFRSGANGTKAIAGVLNKELTVSQAIMMKCGDAARLAASKIKTFASSNLKSTAMTIKDTAANAVNAVSKSRVGTAASGAAKKVLAFASAHKVALLATLGLAAPIIALAVYMAKTGASADEVAAKITGFADKLAGMITTFANAFPSMVDGLVSAFTSVIDSVVAVLPTLIPALLNAAVQLFMALVQALPTVISALTAALPTIITAVVGVLVAALPTLLQAAITLFMALVQAIPTVIDALVAAFPTIIQSIVGVLPTLIPALLQGAITLFMALVQAIPQIIPPLVQAIPQIIDAIVGVLPTLIPALQQASVQLFMAIVQAIPQIIPPLLAAIPQIIIALMSALVAGLQGIWNAVKAGASAAWEGIKNLAAEKWNSIKEKIMHPIDTARQKVNSAIEKIKSYFNFDAIISKVKSKWDSIKNRIVDPIETAKQKVQSALNKIKNMFPLSIGKIFSNLKVPHISVDGGKAPFGIGGKGSLPSFHVNWNAKGAIFDEPTIFATAKGLQGVGEAGAEAVTPIDTLKTYVREAVASENVMQEDLMQRMIDSNNQTNQLLNSILQMLSNQKIEWNDRELGRFVKNYAR